MTIVDFHNHFYPPEYLDALGVTQELPAWREACASLQVASEIP